MPRKNSKKIEYISLIEATKYCDCTQQYLSLRARQGKLKAKKFGRNWATTKKWVEEYFDKSKSHKICAKSKKAHRLSFLVDTYFSAFASAPAHLWNRCGGALGEIGKTIKKLKIIFQSSGFKYIVAGVLAFAILEYGFAYAGPTLSTAKDFFIGGIAVFSEETNKGVSNFSKSAWSFSDTVTKIAKVPSVNIPPAPRINIPSVNIPPAPRINIPSFANFSITISENFPSTRTGARGVIQNFRDVKNYTSDKIASSWQSITFGAKYTFITIAHIPPTVVSNIFVVSDGIENRIFKKTHSQMSRFSIITDNEFYDLGYTGRMVQGYTQWLNQKFVPESLYIVKENVALGAASISDAGKSFYDKYVSKKFR